MIQHQQKIIYKTCPECQKIVKSTELVSIDTGKKLLGFLPVPSLICKSCIEDHNKKVIYLKKIGELKQDES